MKNNIIILNVLLGNEVQFNVASIVVSGNSRIRTGYQGTYLESDITAYPFISEKADYIASPDHVWDDSRGYFCEFVSDSQLKPVITWYNFYPRVAPGTDACENFVTYSDCRLHLGCVWSEDHRTCGYAKPGKVGINGEQLNCEIPFFMPFLYKGWMTLEDCRFNIICPEGYKYFDPLEQICKDVPIGEYSSECDNNKYTCSLPPGVDGSTHMFSSPGQSPMGCDAVHLISSSISFESSESSVAPLYDIGSPTGVYAGIPSAQIDFSFEAIFSDNLGTFIFPLVGNFPMWFVYLRSNISVHELRFHHTGFLGELDASLEFQAQELENGANITITLSLVGSEARIIMLAASHNTLEWNPKYNEGRVPMVTDVISVKNPYLTFGRGAMFFGPIESIQKSTLFQDTYDSNGNSNSVSSDHVTIFDILNTSANNTSKEIIGHVRLVSVDKDIVPHEIEGGFINCEGSNSFRVFPMTVVSYVEIVNPLTPSLLLMFTPGNRTGSSLGVAYPHFSTLFHFLDPLSDSVSMFKLFSIQIPATEEELRSHFPGIVPTNVPVPVDTPSKFLFYSKFGKYETTHLDSQITPGGNSLQWECEQCHLIQNDDSDALYEDFRKCCPSKWDSNGCYSTQECESPDSVRMVPVLNDKIIGFFSSGAWVVNVTDSPVNDDSTDFVNVSVEGVPIDYQIEGTETLDPRGLWESVSEFGLQQILGSSESIIDGVYRISVNWDTQWPNFTNDPSFYNISVPSFIGNEAVGPGLAIVWRFFKIILKGNVPDLFHCRYELPLSIQLMKCNEPPPATPLVEIITMGLKARDINCFARLTSFDDATANFLYLISDRNTLPELFEYEVTVKSYLSIETPNGLPGNPSQSLLSPYGSLINIPCSLTNGILVPSQSLSGSLLLSLYSMKVMPNNNLIWTLPTYANITDYLINYSHSNTLDVIQECTGVHVFLHSDDGNIRSPWLHYLGESKYLAPTPIGGEDVTGSIILDRSLRKNYTLLSVYKGIMSQTGGENKFWSALLLPDNEEWDGETVDTIIRRNDIVGDQTIELKLGSLVDIFETSVPFSSPRQTTVNPNSSEQHGVSIYEARVDLGLTMDGSQKCVTSISVDFFFMSPVKSDLTVLGYSVPGDSCRVAANTPSIEDSPFEMITYISIVPAHSTQSAEFSNFQRTPPMSVVARVVNDDPQLAYIASIGYPFPMDHSLSIPCDGLLDFYSEMDAEIIEEFGLSDIVSGSTIEITRVKISYRIVSWIQVGDFVVSNFSYLDFEREIQLLREVYISQRVSLPVIRDRDRYDFPSDISAMSFEYLFPRMSTIAGPAVSLNMDFFLNTTRREILNEVIGEVKTPQYISPVTENYSISVSSGTGEANVVLLDGQIYCCEKSSNQPQMYLTTRGAVDSWNVTYPFSVSILESMSNAGFVMTQDEFEFEIEKSRSTYLNETSVKEIKQTDESKWNSSSGVYADEVGDYYDIHPVKVVLVYRSRDMDTVSDRTIIDSGILTPIIPYTVYTITSLGISPKPRVLWDGAIGRLHMRCRNNPENSEEHNGLRGISSIGTSVLLSSCGISHRGEPRESVIKTILGFRNIASEIGSSEILIETVKSSDQTMMRCDSTNCQQSITENILHTEGSINIPECSFPVVCITGNRLSLSVPEKKEMDNEGDFEVEFGDGEYICATYTIGKYSYPSDIVILTNIPTRIGNPNTPTTKSRAHFIIISGWFIILLFAYLCISRSKMGWAIQVRRYSRKYIRDFRARISYLLRKIYSMIFTGQKNKTRNRVSPRVQINHPKFTHTMSTEFQPPSDNDWRGRSRVMRRSTEGSPVEEFVTSVTNSPDSFASRNSPDMKKTVTSP